MFNPCSDRAYRMVERLSKRILGDKVVRQRFATDPEDKHDVADIILELADGSLLPVAVRERNPSEYRDCTVRLVNEGGVTEWEKIKNGRGKWFFTRWIRATIGSEWALVDLDLMRNANLFNIPFDKTPWHLLPHDGHSQGTAINVFALQKISQSVIAADVIQPRAASIADILEIQFGPAERLQFLPPDASNNQQK